MLRLSSCQISSGKRQPWAVRSLIDDPRSWFALALRYSAQFPQHSVGTGAQAQGVSKPGRRLTTEGVAQRVQRPSLRSRTTLIPAHQGVDVLGKRTTGAIGVRTLEAAHLNSENDPLLVHRTFFQSAHIAAVESATPTMAGRTRCRANCTAGFDSNGLPSRVAGDEALTHTGENTIDPTENLPHGNDQRTAKPAGNQALDSAVTQSAGDPSLLHFTAGQGRGFERGTLTRSHLGA
ncbi:hypothetical protein LMG26411_05905 [Cupriavidus numazuensis]|uniref:Uncharacterized protein n=1 Tax=Cupriavidus numazuensis TaxID=221992 RepID=A0ABN7Q9T6_9BURK|nr:hypothetical protein LMG26411_05905 [Cupriavidus numazuensis]